MIDALIAHLPPLQAAPFLFHQPFPSHLPPLQATSFPLPPSRPSATPSADGIAINCWIALRIQLEEVLPEKEKYQG
jgi:hypothetical protein